MLSNIGNEILEFLKQILIMGPGLLVGVILHEYAHGYIAYRSGDMTAKNMGRLTLNPIAHIDLFGSIILPLVLILFGSNIIFGYAKPVPVNPGYFRNFRKGIRYTSLAGPVTNLIVAFALGLIYGLYIFLLSLTSMSLIYSDSSGLGMQVILIIKDMFAYAIYINIFLAIFNFIPIPPLDGSKILASFLPDNAMHRYLRMDRFGFIFIFAIIFLLGRFFWGVVSPVISFIFNACTWWQFLLN